MSLPMATAHADLAEDAGDAPGGDPRDADRHYIEEIATVYLKLTSDGWAVDGPALDGYALHGYDAGPISANCECGDKPECEQLVAEAEQLPLPTAEQLLGLLASALGYTVMPVCEQAGVPAGPLAIAGCA